LPNGSRVGTFNTHNKKANFTVNQVSDIDLEEGEYLMMTTRSHDQFNTTIYGLDDRYRGVYNGRMVVFMNHEDVKNLGKKKGDLVSLYNNYDNIERRVNDFAIVPYDVPKGCLFTYFPEANPLVPLSLHARHSHTPSSKSIKVKISA
jgi:anaerobic selenocysteine-containing dehydrogenase